MTELPAWIVETRTSAWRAIAPLRPANAEEASGNQGILYAQRIGTSVEPPPYYLVYFLLVELLDFPSFGAEEKVAWTIPVVLDGTMFAFQHRKLGFGIFALDPEGSRETAERAVRLLHSSTRAAKAYFDWKAKVAVESSRLNVVNRNDDLCRRFEYFRGKYRSLVKEAADRREECVTSTRKARGATITSYQMPALELLQEATHYALATIDAFYSWTEHLFVHLSILNGRCRTGVDVAQLAGEDWAAKYKTAIPLNDPTSKRFFDELLLLRRQIRNFTAHGSFGKDGQAFRFHSAAGAVPVLLGLDQREPTYSLVGFTAFTEGTAIELMDAFVEYLWNDSRRPARMYLMESGLPVLLTLAEDNTYASAMESEEEMGELIRHLTFKFDQAANMDW